MNFRTTGAIAALLIGIGASAGDASAQYSPQPGYREQQAPQGYEPAATGTRPYYGSPNPNYAAPAAGTPYEPDAARPPLPITPGYHDVGQGEPAANGGAASVDPRNM